MNLSLCKNVISHSLKIPPQISTKPQFSSLFCSSQQPKLITMRDYLVTQHGFSPKTADKVSSIRTLIKSPENADSVLQFLKQNGFSNTHLHKIVERFPNILFSNLDNTVKPKIETFQHFGFANEDLADIITTDPWVLTRSIEQQLLPSLLVLKKVLGTSSDVSKALKLSGWFLKHDLSKTMMPNIEFMVECGILRSQINRMIFHFPRFFVLRPDGFKELVRRADELGVDRSSMMFFYALRTLGSMTKEKWELKLDLFRDLGFMEDEMLIMFRRKPMVFAVSETKLRQVAEYLVGTGRCDVCYIAAHPDMLLYSLEDRIKPRIQVFQFLDRKGSISKRLGLSSLLKMPEASFFEKFVSPYINEVGSLYTPKKGL